MEINLSQMGIKWPKPKGRGSVWYKFLSAVLTRRDCAVNIVNALAGRGAAKTYHMMLALFILMTDERYGYVGEEFTWYGPTTNTEDYDDTFLGAVEKIFPQSIYKLKYAKKMIVLANGSKLRYRGRLATNSNREPARGPGGRVIALDENCKDPTDKAWKTIFGTLRGYEDTSRPYIIMNSTTPLLGSWFQDVVENSNSITLTATSYDNPVANSGAIDEFKDQLSDEEIEQEVYGGWVALSGKAWSNVNLKEEWPNGNVHPHTFDTSMPFSVWCDLGVQSAWIIVQHVPIRDQYGWEPGKTIDVAVAQYTPNHGNTDAVGQEIINDYGYPSLVITGSDLTTRNINTGDTAEMILIRNLGWNCPIIPVTQPWSNKQLQYGAALRCIKTSSGHRQFCVSKELKTHMPNKRGLIEMFNRDVWPEKVRMGEFLTKDKRTRGGTAIEDIRDAFIYGCTMMHKPPAYKVDLAA